MSKSFKNKIKDYNKEKQERSKPIEIRCIKCKRKAFETQHKYISVSVVCARCKTPYTYVEGNYSAIVNKI